MEARVLLLEDDVALACEIQAALAQVGCRVEILRDGTQGLVRAVSDHFDIVLASLELPGMNGFRVCNRFKKDPNVKATPFFLLSSEASATDFEQHQSLPTHAEAYFRKPVMIPELIARMRAHLPKLAPNGTRPPPADDPFDDLIVFDEPELVGIPPQRLPRSLAPPLAVPRPLTRPPDAASISHQEQEIIRLKRELADAQVSAEAAASDRREIARLRMEVEQARARPRSSQLPPARASGDAVPAHELLVYRQQLVKKDAQLATLTTELDSKKQAVIDLKERVRVLELANKSMESVADEPKRQLAQAEKLLAVARADREQAVRRAEDVSRRFERVKPDLEAAERALAAEKTAHESDVAVHARALAEAEALRQRDQAEANRAHADEIASVRRAHSEERGRLMSEHEARATELRRELEEIRSAHDELWAASTTSDQDHKEKLDAQLAVVRAEHVEALATAQRGFEHEKVVLRHEHETKLEQFKTEARRAVQRARETAAGQVRDVESKHAAAKERWAQELGEAKRVAEEAQRGAQAEREARAEEMAANAHALSDLAAGRQRDREAAEKKIAAFRAEHQKIVAARAEAYAVDVARIRAEQAAAGEAWRQKLVESENAHKEQLARELQQARNAASEELATKLRRSRSEQEEWLAAVRRSYEEQLDGARKERDAEVQRVRDEARTRASEIEAERDARLEEAAQRALAVDAERSKELSEANRVAAEARETLAREKATHAAEAAQHAQELADLARATDAQLAERLERYRAEQDAKMARELAAKEQAHAEELGRERAAFEALLGSARRELSEARTKHDEAISGLTLRLEEQAREDLAAKLAAAKAKQSEEIAGLLSAWDEEREMLRRDREAAFARAEQQSLRVVEQAEAAHAQEALHLKQTICDLERQQEIQLSAAAQARAELEGAVTTEKEARYAEAAAHATAIAELAQAREAERAESARRLGEVESARVAALAAREQASNEALARLRSDLESDLATVREELERSRLAGEQAAAEAAATAERSQQETETRLAELTETHRREVDEARGKSEAAVAVLVQGHEQALAALRDEHQKKIRDAEAEAERRLREAQEAAAATEAQRAKDMSEAESRHEAALTEAQRALAQAALMREADLSELKLQMARELRESQRNYEEQLVTARDRARAEALAEAEARHAEELTEQIRQLGEQHQKERELSVAELDRAHAETLTRARAEWDKERAELGASLETREEALSESRQMFHAERANRTASESAAATRIEALEALITSRLEDIDRLSKELAHARTELPALEGEIAVLRSELTSARIQLDDRVRLAQVAAEQTARDRLLLDKAKRTLTEALAQLRPNEPDPPHDS
jgi:DNA-binding response OmpR family regulator